MRHQHKRIALNDPDEMQNQQERLIDLPTQPFCTENSMPTTELKTLRSNGAFEFTYYDSSNTSSSSSSSSSSSFDDDTNNNNNDHDPSTFTNSNDDKTPSLTNATKVFALCAALNSCNLGYDIQVCTNAGPQIQAAFSLSDLKLEITPPRAATHATNFTKGLVFLLMITTSFFSLLASTGCLHFCPVRKHCSRRFHISQQYSQSQSDSFLLVK
jgi:hypothetical protein